MIKQYIYSAQHFLIDSYFPPHCICCNSENVSHFHFICSKCLESIRDVKTTTCPECGKITDYGSYCDLCRKKAGEMKGIIYVGKHDGSLKELVHWFKYNGMLNIADLLVDLLETKFINYKFNDSTCVVPVPMNWRKKFARGFNQSEILAKKLSKRLKIKYILALKKIKYTKAQMSLKKSDRQKNILGVFKIINGRRIPDQILDKTVFLVDDVMTTGSTLNECAKLLKENGAKKVIGLVVTKD